MKRRLRIAAILVVAGVILWALHPRLLSAALGWGLPRLVGLGGMELRMERVEASIGRPWVFRGVLLVPQAGRPSRTGMRVQELRLGWSGLTGMWGRRGTLLEKLELREVEIVRERLAGPPPSAGIRDGQNPSRWLLPLLHPILAPREIVVSRMNIEMVWPEGWVWVEGLEARLREGRWGHVQARDVQAGIGERTWKLGGQYARAFLGRGALYMAEAEIRPGLRLESLWVQPTGGGAGFELAAEVFGGLLRGGGRIGEWRGKPGMDAAFWAADVELAGLTEFLGLGGETSGRIGEARLTFRGLPANWQDAEAALHLDARDVQRKLRRWDQLEISATLVNRRLSLPKLALKQGANSLSMRGEMAISGGWAELAASPVHLDLSAQIADLAQLGALVGVQPRDWKGRMTISARLSGRMQRPEGFVSIEASDLAMHGMRWDSAKIEALLRRGEAQIELFELSRGRDVISGKGQVGLSSPHEYSGQVVARISNLGNSLPTAWAANGQLELRWQGDGRANAHSGAFQASLEKVKTPWTPAGLTGRFAGTYSPESLYLGGCELIHERLTLSLRATLAKAGIQVADLELRDSKRRVVSGEGYLPLDFFGLWKGQEVAAAVLPEKSVHLRLESQQPVRLEGLFGLLGQRPTCRGLLHGEAKFAGPPDALEGTSRFVLSGFQPISGKAEGPGVSSTLTWEAKVGGQRLQLAGNLESSRVLAARIAADLPFGWRQGAAGQAEFLRRQEPFSFEAKVPGLQLELLQPFWPQVRGLAGRLEGQLSGTGTLESPLWDGQLKVRGGKVEGLLGPRGFLISGVEGELRARGAEWVLASCHGLLEESPWTLHGRLTLPDWAGWQLEARVEGQGLPVLNTRTEKLLMDYDLQVAANAKGGQVTGETRLRDGRLLRTLEITPTPLPRVPTPWRPIEPPDFSGFLPKGAGQWALDVRVHNATPFLLAGHRPAGEIKPDLRLVGMLSKPVPEGAIEIRNARILLPLTVATVPQGRIEFFADQPWLPHVDMRGAAEMLNYDVFLRVRGPLSRRSLLLRSEPQLPPEQLLSLLTTGFLPGNFSGASPGDAWPGKGLSMGLTLPGMSIPALPESLSVSNKTPPLALSPPDLRGRVRLWQALAEERVLDESGFYNVEAGMSLRFR